MYKSRSVRTGTRWWIGLACLVLSAGCGPKQPVGPLIPVEPDDLPEFTDDLDMASLRVAVERTMPRWAAAGDADSTMAATRLLDAIARRLPGALAEGSGEHESFSEALEGGLEYPHYTRPAAYRGWDVPDVLLSGDHARIDRWRREQSRARSLS